jgi:hypothetical protein
MTHVDHTAAWRRLRNLVLCRRCGEFPGVGCECPPKGFRGRLRALVMRWTRSRRRTANRLRKEVAKLTAEVAALKARIRGKEVILAAMDAALNAGLAMIESRDAEIATLREREANKREYLDTMTPGRRGRA